MVAVRKISASKLNLYSKCPFAYYLERVRHLKVPQSSRLVFGSVIHRMLESFYEKNYKNEESFANAGRGAWLFRTNPEELAKRGEEIKWFGADKEAEKNERYILAALGKSILKDFYLKNKKEDKYIDRPLLVEARFNFSFDNFKITGIIDRIERENGIIKILDYKTNKNFPTKIDLDRSDQLTIYDLATKKDPSLAFFLGKVKKTIVGIYHLRSGEIFFPEDDKEKIAVRNKDDFNYLKIKLRRFVENVENDCFLPTDTFGCKFCDFQFRCKNMHFKVDSKNLEDFIVEERDVGRWEKNLAESQIIRPPKPKRKKRKNKRQLELELKL